MSIETAMTRDAVIVRKSPGTENTHGRKVSTESARASVKVYLEQTTATEVVVGRETQVSDHLMVAPAGTQIDGDDEVIIEGVTYIVIGPPSRPHSPLSGEHHVEARLRTISG